MKKKELAILERFIYFAVRVCLQSERALFEPFGDFFLSKWTITQDTHKSTNLKQEIGDGTWVLYEIGLIITVEKGWTDILHI